MQEQVEPDGRLSYEEQEAEIARLKATIKALSIEFNAYREAMAQAIQAVVVAHRPPPPRPMTGGKNG